MRQHPFYGKTALVTGASGGIGAEFARQLAACGSNLILVARRESLLHGLTEELSRNFGVDAVAIAADLTEPGAVEALYRQLRKEERQVDILVNNAGAGVYGEFTEIPWDQERKVLELDILALTELTKRFGEDMAFRRSGHILLVSSLLAYLPAPQYTTYAAAKAYVSSLAVSLNRQFRRSGVVCTCLCPGFTDTGFFHAAGREPSRLQRLMMLSAADVARVGIKALAKQKRTAAPGFVNKLGLLFFPLLPEPVTLRLAEFLMR